MIALYDLITDLIVFYSHLNIDQCTHIHIAHLHMQLTE